VDLLQAIVERSCNVWLKTIAALWVVLTPKYTTIKSGLDDKIVAKCSCSDGRRAVSFYSVNVTGVATIAATSLVHN
jgi:hypothetical protein